MLQHEREQRQRLQEMVETLAEQHSKLERAANAHAHRAGKLILFTQNKIHKKEYTV